MWGVKNPFAKSAFASGLLIALLSTTWAAPAGPSAPDPSPQDLESLKAVNLTWPPYTFTVEFEPATGASAGEFAETDAQQVTVIYALNVAVSLNEETFDTTIVRRTPNGNLELAAGGWPEPSDPVQAILGVWGLVSTIFKVHFRPQLALGRWYLVSEGNRKGFFEFRKPADGLSGQAEAETQTHASLPLGDGGEIIFETEDTEIELQNSHSYFYPLMLGIQQAAESGPEDDMLSWAWMGFGTQGVTCNVFNVGRGEAPPVRRDLALAMYKAMSVPRRFVKTTTTMSYVKNHQLVHNMMQCTIGTGAGDAAGQVIDPVANAQQAATS